MEGKKYHAAIILLCIIRQYQARRKLLFLSHVVTSSKNYDTTVRIQTVVRRYIAAENNHGILLTGTKQKNHELDEEKEMKFELQQKGFYNNNHHYHRQQSRERVNENHNNNDNTNNNKKEKLPALDCRFVTKKDEAAIILQCFARMLIANNKASLLLDELSDKEEGDAASILQRCVRQDFFFYLQKERMLLY